MEAPASASRDHAASVASTLNLLRLTADIVAAHVSSNPLSAQELPDLIKRVFHALRGPQAAGTAAKEPAAPVRERARPAVAIGKSVFASYLVCLEDGKKLKMLKRHLQTSYGMTPDQYRAKWDLDPNYPMVAPEYAQKRSTLAKAIGLGTRPKGRD